jgi:hypothetical protein
MRVETPKEDFLVFIAGNPCFLGDPLFTSRDGTPKIN